SELGPLHHAAARQFQRETAENQEQGIDPELEIGQGKRLPVRCIAQMIGIVWPCRSKASYVGNGQGNKHDHYQGEDSGHADESAGQAPLAGVRSSTPIAVAIVASAVAPAMRNLARAAASQLRLAFYFNVLAYDRHNCSRCWTSSSRAGRGVLHHEIRPRR